MKRVVVAIGWTNVMWTRSSVVATERDIICDGEGAQDACLKDLTQKQKKNITFSLCSIKSGEYGV